MSKSKKAVIVASIFIVVGVIIAFLSIAINGFHFPNGSVDLLGMKALPDYVKKQFRSQMISTPLTSQAKHLPTS